jgi:hypothetical protein
MLMSKCSFYFQSDIDIGYGIRSPPKNPTYHTKIPEEKLAQYVGITNI